MQLAQKGTGKVNDEREMLVRVLVFLCGLVPRTSHHVMCIVLHLFLCG